MRIGTTFTGLQNFEGCLKQNLIFNGVDVKIEISHILKIKTEQ